MLDPNTFMVARAIHERRVAEALQKQRHRPLRELPVSLLTRLLFNLGNGLVDLGQKLKTQAAATPLPPELVEA